jgi:predicted nucleotidyltransferase
MFILFILDLAIEPFILDTLDPHHVYIVYFRSSIMSEEEDDCLYDKLIEPNRLRIVKYFDPYVVFDIMRQECVITMDDQERIQNMYPPTRRARAGKIQIDCYIIMDDQECIHNMYPPTRRARAGKIQIDCYIIMDDQECIHNMYPPTRRARTGKIQIDCYIIMDDQEGIQNMYPPT